MKEAIAKTLIINPWLRSKSNIFFHRLPAGCRIVSLTFRHPFLPSDNTIDNKFFTEVPFIDFSQNPGRSHNHRLFERPSYFHLKYGAAIFGKKYTRSICMGSTLAFNKTSKLPLNMNI